MTTKEKIEVMQAFEDGKVIECADLPYSDDDADKELDWSAVPAPCWDWNNYDFRIKTAPATMIERIQAEYGEYKVKMLKWASTMAGEQEYLMIPVKTVETCGSYKPHTEAQSMRGFYRYVYYHESLLWSNRFPTVVNNNETFQPLAVLFTK